MPRTPKTKTKTPPGYSKRTVVREFTDVPPVRVALLEESSYLASSGRVPRTAKEAEVIAAWSRCSQDTTAARRIAAAWGISPGVLGTLLGWRRGRDVDLYEAARTGFEGSKSVITDARTRKPR